jgi:CubicO group peptidase (beta-lactamase class C family)
MSLFARVLWLLACLVPCAARADAVDDYVQVRMTARHIPGLAVAVLRDGKPIKIRGYGAANVELEAPVTPDTVFPIASVTKQFVAAAVLLLEQDGKLAVDDRIGAYLDNAPEAWTQITIRQLLNHTSGIADVWNDLHADRRAPTTPEKIVQLVGAVPLTFAPGTKWNYSNTDYIVLAMIVKKISGVPFEAFLQQRIFTPLGMTRTRLYDPDNVIRGRAAGYERRDGALHNAEYFDPSFAQGGDGGLLSTANDLARWAAALDGDGILNAKSREMMWSGALLANGTTHPYGFGWELRSANQHRWIYHSGSRPGAAAVVSRFPDDRLTVIVLANLSHADTITLARNIAGLYVPSVALPVYKAIADDQPQTTALVAGFFRGMTAPAPDETFLTPRLLALAKPVWDGFRADFVSLGALRSAVLVQQEPDKDGARLLRRYRLSYAETSVIARIAIHDGRIDDVLGIEAD